MNLTIFEIAEVDFVDSESELEFRSNSMVESKRNSVSDIGKDGI